MTGAWLALAVVAAAMTVTSATAPVPVSCCKCQILLNSNKEEFCKRVPTVSQAKCLGGFDNVFQDCKNLLGYNAKPVEPKDAEDLTPRATWMPMKGVCANSTCPCRKDTNDCSEHASCFASNAGQTCDCKPGYVGDGKTCKGEQAHS